jgi:hypothetical protein
MHAEEVGFNPEENFLEDDDPIPRQNYVCLSFVSPEKVLEDKHLYYMWHYERHLQAKIEELNTKLKEVLNKDDDIVEDSEVKKPEPCTFTNFKEMFLDFEYTRHTDIEKEFYELNDFRTTVRGLKIRGTYDTRREAQRRSKKLQQLNPNDHIGVGVVGAWMPWDPDPDDIEDQEYALPELNELMQKKKENEMKKNIHWEQEKRAKLEAAQRQRLLHQEKQAAQLKDKEDQEDQEGTATSTEGGGGSKEDTPSESATSNAPQPVNVVSDEVKTGLDGNDPWLQRKLDEARAASDSVNDKALQETIDKLSAN